MVHLSSGPFSLRQASPVPLAELDAAGICNVPGALHSVLLSSHSSCLEQAVFGCILHVRKMKLKPESVTLEFEPCSSYFKNLLLSCLASQAPCVLHCDAQH